MTTPTGMVTPTDVKTESVVSNDAAENSSIQTPPDILGVPNVDEEMLSLDVLSFKEEVCSSQQCLCSSRRNHPHQDDNDLSVFGARISSRLPMKRQLDETPSLCTGLCRHRKIISPPVFSPPNSAAFGRLRPLETQPSLVPLSTRNDTNAAVFGAQHSGHADFRQISQLQSSGNGQPTQCSITSFQGASFQSPHLHNRSAVDMSDLRSVLQDVVTTSELSPPSMTTCPAHRQTMAAPGGLSMALTTPPCTCSQQASRLDDWTVDELAGYLDDFCYIPKKMSAMAEMMYM